MNRVLSLMLLLCVYSYVNGQATFSSENIINSNDINGPRSVYAADIDGDGDLDILSASNGDNKVAWYENTDNLGHFGPQQLITNATIGANSVVASDLDGDNDLDVLSASSFDAKITWYSNTNGTGTFGTQQVISNQCQYAMSVAVADIDMDGDLDVVSASLSDDKIAWYANTDGAGTFGTQQIISTQADGALSVQVADINGDGWVDVISASMLDGKVAWYENIEGSFSEQKLITNALNQPRAIYCTDIDKDGDIDVLAASSADNTVSWYENTDAAGSFGPQNVIANDVIGATSVAAADIDLDGDQDVITCSYNTNVVMWYKNTDGLGHFGQRNVINNTAQGPNHLYIADLNGDNKQDVIVACEIGNKLVWHQNETHLSIVETGTHLSYKLYPQPVVDRLHIDLKQETIQKMCVLDMFGKQLQWLADTQNTIDMSNFKPGIYLLRIYTDKRILVQKVVKI